MIPHRTLSVNYGTLYDLVNDAMGSWRISGSTDVAEFGAMCRAIAMICNKGYGTRAYFNTFQDVWRMIVTAVESYEPCGRVAIELLNKYGRE